LGERQVNQQTPRVAPIAAPAEYVLPGRAEGGSGDPYRQTQFLLGEDLALFAEAMNLQLRLAKDAFPFSRFRTHALVAITGLWSRSFMYLSDALLLTVRGSYASTLPLVRTACEVIGAQEALRAGEMGEHDQWLTQTLHPNEEFKAFDFEMGRYFAGNTLASDPLLGSIYRPVGDLARVHFGSTLIQVGPESNNTRLSLSFGDTSFHQGWAELILGWLLALAARQVRVIVDAADAVFPVSDEARTAYEDLQHRIDAALGRGDRCSLTEVRDGNDRRYLISSFRRSSGAAPKKVIL
jgi:hypothetical protein